MRIQEMIEKLQAIFNEKGNLQVECRNQAGDLSDCEYIEVGTDYRKLPIVRIDA